MTTSLKPTPAEYTQRARECQQRADRMREDAQGFRELAELWREHCTRDAYGWRHEELGDGIQARVELVANWIEHVAEQEQTAATDYAGAARFQQRLDDISGDAA